MTFVYLICFLLITVGAIILLRLNPEKITDDLMRFVSPKQTLREKVLTAKGKKRSRKLTVELNRIRDALEQTGKGGQFSIACAASVVLMIFGCILAIMIDNAFLIPVFAIAFAMIPFAYAKRTVNYYDNHIKEELETSLSIITTSYVRTDDIVTAVKENMQHLKPPVKEIFAGFVAENMMISADIKQSIRHLKEKVSNSIFDEWCDTLIACQDDRTLKDTLMPIVSKLTDVRIVNNEIKGMLVAARTEYFMMAAMVVGNIPLLYFLNKDWYAALMYTTLGKIVLAVCGLAIIVTAMLMFRFTKQVEYRKRGVYDRFTDFHCSRRRYRVGIRSVGCLQDTEISRIQSHYRAWKKAEEKDQSAGHLARRPGKPHRRQTEA